MKSVLIALCLPLLASCASTADIDMNKADATCGQTCTATYSACLQKFTLFPIQAQHQCTDALRLCVQACPPRKTEDVRRP